MVPSTPIAPAPGDEQYPSDWSDDPISVTATMTCC